MSYSSSYSAHNSSSLSPKWNCQPLLSSQSLGWKDIQFNHYRHHPYVLPRHRYSQYLLKVFLTEGEIKRCLNEEEQIERVGSGDVVIIPPDTIHHASWQQEIEFVLLSFQPEIVESLLIKKTKCISTKVLPQFARQDSLISGIIMTLKAQFESDADFCHECASTLCNAIAIHLLEKYSESSTAIRISDKDSVEQKLRIIQTYIEQNLGEKLTLDIISRQVNLSKYYLCRLFTKHLDISPRQYIIQRRIAKSKQLLKQEQTMQVVDIALICGFANHSHFNRQFNKSVGMSPKTYRDSLI